MDSETQNIITELQERLSTLEEKYKALLNFSSIPIDLENALIKRGFLKFDGNIIFYEGAAGNAFPHIFVKYADKKSLLAINNYMVSFYVTIADDTCHSPAHGFNDGDVVLLSSTIELPAGLDIPAVDYQIFNATTNTFQLSADGGATAVDITSVGQGVHYAQSLT